MWFYCLVAERASVLLSSVSLMLSTPVDERLDSAFWSTVWAAFSIERWARMSKQRRTLSTNSITHFSTLFHILKVMTGTMSRRINATYLRSISLQLPVPHDCSESPTITLQQLHQSYHWKGKSWKHGPGLRLYWVLA